jgi:hypothetical protein
MLFAGEIERRGKIFSASSMELLLIHSRPESGGLPHFLFQLLKKCLFGR